MGSAGAAWAFSGCLVVRLGLWRVHLRFFGFGRFSPEALVFSGGSWIISSGFAEGLKANVGHGWADVLRLVIGLTELSEFGYKF